MTCEFGNQIQDAIYVNYTYHEYSDYDKVYRTFAINTSKWPGDNTAGLRSDLYSYIYPCITISLSKEDYVNN